MFIQEILIHTSVKLVTCPQRYYPALFRILIHTSVKLVTLRISSMYVRHWILIHTSVKLVTRDHGSRDTGRAYFNPHEREARDVERSNSRMKDTDFNPHEREARDLDPQSSIGRAVILIHTSVKLVTDYNHMYQTLVGILIHTSVKLVTLSGTCPFRLSRYFNPHEREARDVRSLENLPPIEILIHTSVKLVTTPLLCSM